MNFESLDYLLRISGLLLGLELGLLFLVTGLAAGLWLGRRVDRESPKSQLPSEQVVRTLGGLYQWSSGMASEVEEHRQQLARLASHMENAERQDETGEQAGAEGLLAQIVSANERLQSRLDEAESALKMQAEEVASYLTEARTDALTALPNRRALSEELSRALAEWRRYGTPLSLILVDVDRFKQLNDRHGHLAGDAVLAAVARTLRQVLRDCDLAARFGGEEFALLLKQTDLQAAGLAAERVRRGIEEARFTYEGVSLPVTVSCGVAQAQTAEEAAALLKRCDEALYAAKRGGRNRAWWHAGDRLVPLVAGFPAEDQLELPAVSQATVELSPLNRACHDLRRRLLEVAAR